MKNQIYILFILIITIITTGCDNSALKKADEYVPNEVPVITSFTSNVTDRTMLIPAMQITLTVEAHDPEQKPLEYIFTSDTGAFQTQVDSETGSTTTYVVSETLTGGEEVKVTLTVKDEKGAKVTQTLDLGTGKTGPAIASTTPPNRTTLSATSTETLTISADSDGFYQVQLVNPDDPIGSDGSYMKKDSGTPFYFYSANEPVTINIGGPNVLGADINLNHEADNAGNTIRVVFADFLWQETKADFTFTVDETGPSLVNTQPSDKMFLKATEGIIMQFDEPVRNPTCSVDGSSVPCSVNETDSTVTITPDGEWPSHLSNTFPFEITVDDAVGNTSNTVELNYYVFKNIIKVTSADGIASAFNTINEAGLYPAAVLFAEGIYNSNNRLINMVDNVSVFGGFNSTFEQRDIESYKTILENTKQTLGFCSSENDSLEAVLIENITTDLKLEGFYIKTTGSNATDCCVPLKLVNNSGTPIIQNNIIIGGESKVDTFGVWASSSNIKFQNNLVTGGKGSSSNAIFISSNSTTINSYIRNNTLYAGNGSSASSTIFLFAANNTSTFLNASIDNNIIICDTGNNKIGISYGQTDGTTTINSLRNNAFLGITSGQYLMIESFGGYANTYNKPNELNDLSFADNNVSYNSSDYFNYFINFTPGEYNLNDSNWRISNSAFGSTVDSLRTGGLTGTTDWGFSTDITGKDRTVGWSIGAYEYLLISYPK
mgnify:CR=1 FL=1